jgi:hypothetical protein
MRRPTCPAVIVVTYNEGPRRLACGRRRWHRGEHRAFQTLPTWEYVACWPRNWRERLARALRVIESAGRGTR